MKKTNKINLNQLAKKEVDMKKSEMKTVRGGVAYAPRCSCNCWAVSDPTADNPIATSSNEAN